MKLQQHGLAFAVHIISTHFGDPVGEVCTCLLQKGSLTFQELIRFTKLDNSLLKNCLLVLTQHNCVQAFSAEKSGKYVTHYMVLFSNIIHRMRFPKFIAIVEKALDKATEDLFEGILQHGRLTLEQVISRAMSKQTEGVDRFFGFGTLSSSVSFLEIGVRDMDIVHQLCSIIASQGIYPSSGNADTVRANFVRLVNAHFVMRCPKAEPSLETPEVDPSAKRARTTRMPETVEQRALSAAAPLDAERFFIVTNTDNDSSDAIGTKSKETAAGKKRKHEALEIDDETRTLYCEKEVLWCPNFEEFIRHLRHKACVENVRLRLDDGAATVLDAILEMSSRSQTKVKEEKSVPLSLDAILQELRGRPYPQLTTEQVLNALMRLGCKADSGEEEKLYSIGLKTIIQAAQIAEIESLVKKRYGTDAHRVFRFLTRSGTLVETTRISDQILIDKKEAVKNLFMLFKDGYVDNERVNAKDSVLLWKVPQNTIWEHVLDDMYHAALNLSERLAYELKQDQEILTLHQRNETQQKRVDRLNKVRVVIASSLLQLDDAIMLFQEF